MMMFSWMVKAMLTLTKRYGLNIEHTKAFFPNVALLQDSKIWTCCEKEL